MRHEAREGTIDGATARCQVVGNHARGGRPIRPGRGLADVLKHFGGDALACHRIRRCPEFYSAIIMDYSAIVGRVMAE